MSNVIIGILQNITMVFALHYIIIL